MHVEIVVARPAGALEAHGRVRRHERDDAVLDGERLPDIVLAARGPDVLALVSLASRTHRRLVSAYLAEVVTLQARIVIDRVALRAAGRAFAVPAATATPPDLGVHVRVLPFAKPKREDDVGQVDAAVVLAAAIGILLEQVTRGMVAQARIDHRSGRRSGCGRRGRSGCRLGLRSRLGRRRLWRRIEQLQRERALHGIERAGHPPHPAGAAARRPRLRTGTGVDLGGRRSLRTGHRRRRTVGTCGDTELSDHDERRRGHARAAPRTRVQPPPRGRPISSQLTHTRPLTPLGARLPPQPDADPQLTIRPASAADCAAQVASAPHARRRTASFGSWP